MKRKKKVRRAGRSRSLRNKPKKSGTRESRPARRAKKKVKKASRVRSGRKQSRKRPVKIPLETPRRGRPKFPKGFKTAYALIKKKVSRVEDNKDFSIDGESRFTIGRGMSAVAVLRHARDKVSPLPRTLWVSLGVVFETDAINAKSRKGYERIKGRPFAATKYRRGDALIYAYVACKNKILKVMQGRYRRKASEILVRLHWNPKGKQPK